MTQVKALQLTYLKREPKRIEVLVRGVFWPLWPLRGKVVLTPDEVSLKLPFTKLVETLPRTRIEHLLLDKLGAGVFVMLVLKDLPAPEATDASDAEAEGQAADGAGEPAAAVPAVKPVVPAPTVPKPGPKVAAKAAPVEPEAPTLEKRYLGFFADPEEARALGETLTGWGYGLVSWLGNWRKA